MNSTVLPKKRTGSRNRLIGFVFIITAILLLPLVAMQFTNEVNWTLSDFIFAGMMLVATAAACEVLIRLLKTKGNRIIACAIFLLALCLVWIELAVGVFGSSFAGN